MDLIKQNKFLAAVSGAISFVALVSFILSFLAIMEVSQESKVSLPWAMPLLFETSLISLSVGLIYIKAHNINSQSLNWLAYITIPVISLLSIIFNVYHSWEFISGVGQTDMVGAGLVIVLHAMPPLMVLILFKFLEELIFHTFQNKTEDMLKSVKEKLESLSDQLDNTKEKNLLLEKLAEEKTVLSETLEVQLSSLESRLKEFETMPEFTLVLAQVMTGDKEAEVLEKYGLSKTRVTRLLNDLLY